MLNSVIVRNEARDVSFKALCLLFEENISKAKARQRRQRWPLGTLTALSSSLAGPDPVELDGRFCVHQIGYALVEKQNCVHRAHRTFAPQTFAVSVCTLCQ